MNQLSIPYKNSNDITTNLATAVNDYLVHKSLNPHSFDSDLDSWINLRRNAIIHHNPNYQFEYLNHLNNLLLKFPSDLNLNFEYWLPFPNDASYSLNECYTLSDLNYERCCLLFNIGAYYSQKASHQSRSDTQSIKLALQDLQLSAGVFKSLIEDLSALPTSTTPDLTSDFLNLLSTLMLAQAQECFWQKAVIDNLKNGTIAKISLGVSKLYEDACNIALNNNPQPADALPSIWISHMQVKAHHFAAAAQYRKSLDDLSSCRYGEELSRLNLASELVKKALEFSKRNKVFDAVRHDLKGLQDTLIENINRANKDNDMIYLQDIPHPLTLSGVQPAIMVKSISPSNTSIPNEQLLFKSLTPFAVDLANNLWNNRKQNKLKEFESKSALLDKLQAETLHSLGLPGSLQAIDRTKDIPPSLLKKVENVQADGGFDLLYNLSQDVELLADNNQTLLNETLELINQEYNEDQNCRSQLPELNIESSAKANAKYVNELNQLKSTLEAASRSDEIVQQKINNSKHDIEVLSLDKKDLKERLPKVQVNVIVNDTSFRNLRSALERLDDIVDDRRILIGDTKSIMRRDEIIGKINEVYNNNFDSNNNDRIDMMIFDELFENEMIKYDKIQLELNSNELNQAGLLENIKILNTDFLNLKMHGGKYEERQSCLQNLDLSYYTYVEIKNNLSEGLQFYNDFSNLLQSLKTSVENYIHHRRLERSISIQKLESHIENLTLEESINNDKSKSPLKTFAKIPSSTAHNFGEWDESKPIRFG